MSLSGTWVLGERDMSVVCCNLHVRATGISPQGASARILVGSLSMFVPICAHWFSKTVLQSRISWYERDVSFYMGWQVIYMGRIVISSQAFSW